MCSFQSLHFSNDGYVVRCRDCNHYQVGFASTMLTLVKKDLVIFADMVSYKATESEFCPNENCKNIIIPTPYQGVNVLLTITELKKLNMMLEEADAEEKTQSLLDLFNS